MRKFHVVTLDSDKRISPGVPGVVQMSCEVRIFRVHICTIYVLELANGTFRFALERELDADDKWQATPE